MKKKVKKTLKDLWVVALILFCFTGLVLGCFVICGLLINGSVLVKPFDVMTQGSLIIAAALTAILWITHKSE